MALGRNSRSWSLRYSACFKSQRICFNERDLAGSRRGFFISRHSGVGAAEEAEGELKTVSPALLGLEKFARC
jgi:hypothetical protein